MIKFCIFFPVSIFLAWHIAVESKINYLALKPFETIKPQLDFKREFNSN